ncbi:hypothetical protein POM88_032986 [Heracleum sosnowskyi]|uniref:Uncharacterized protein n=1 Tax=Heracleum sosnowskyi TaxID=360622 RepID=A0AAD8I1A1_9APIA|nr:hypothetical protein POM88_032986 [Heracleum sosnowskyi]
MSVSRVFSSLKLGIYKPSPVFFHQRKAVPMEQSWRKKPQATKSSSTAATEDVSNRLRELSVAEDSGQSHASVSSVQFGTVGTLKHVPAQGVKSIWKPKSYGTVSGATSIEIEKPKADQDRIAKDGGGSITASAEKNDNAVSKFFNGKMLEDFTVYKSTYSGAQIRAIFYPKFENEKSDQEVRTRMVELVSKGLDVSEDVDDKLYLEEIVGSFGGTAVLIGPSIEPVGDVMCIKEISLPNCVVDLEAVVDVFEDLEDVAQASSSSIGVHCLRFEILVMPSHMLTHCHGVDVKSKFSHFRDVWKKKDYITVYDGSRSWKFEIRKRRESKRTVSVGALEAIHCLF